MPPSTSSGESGFSKPIKIEGPTDLQRLGRQLEWLRVRFLELAQEKNKFLRHMSHELKTPLANIREGTELLLDGSVGELDAVAARGRRHSAHERHEVAAADRKPVVVQRLAGQERGPDTQSEFPSFASR